MKRPIITLLAFCFFALAQSIAQDEEPTSIITPNGGTAKVLFIDHGVINGLDTLDITNGLEIAYLRTINDWVRLNFPIKIGVADIAGNLNRKTIISFDASIQLPLFKKAKRISPYLMGGAGFAVEFGNNMDDSHLQFPIGIGADIFLGGQSFINFQVEYRKATIEQRDNLQFGLGYLFRLVRKNTPDEKADRDGDGIGDAIDKCPDQPGPATAAGCPDADGDGVTDINDNCPDEKGTLAANGCPDDDNDGVANKYDDCPQEAGPPAKNGCPEKDSDQDGVPDDEDNCPDEKGSAATDGCPDGDGDGVPDKYDLCPTEIGKKYTSGCPDQDQDGIADKFDDCPELAGPPERRGCPMLDQDQDGVPDAQDDCPTLAGPQSTSGCPDTDKDGIHDGVDKCPNTPGQPENAGCPEIEREVQDLLSMATKNVQFESGNSKLLPSSYSTLNQVAALLKRYPDYHLRITGHSDNVGLATKNQQLSEQRALACYDYLIGQGINAERIIYIGMGESRPIASNDTPEGRAQNRRVEFELFLN